MVKKIFLSTVALIFLHSCCDAYLNSNSALRSKRLYKKHLKSLVDPREINIETDKLYQSINVRFEEKSGKILKFNNSDGVQNLLKFYPNGVFYRYKLYDSINNAIEINKFIPENGELNFIIKRNDKYFFMQYSTINCGAFSKNEFKIINDTLLISAGSNKGFRIWYYYVAKPLPIGYTFKEPEYQ